MISITRAQIPSYLVGSSFYESLCTEDTKKNCVPMACFKSTESVSGVEDLAHLLRTLQYWGVKDVPFELTTYLVGDHSASENEQIYHLLVDFDSHTKFSDWYKAFQTLRMVDADSTDKNTVRTVKRALLVLIEKLSCENDVVSEHAAESLCEAVQSRKCSKHTVLRYLRGACAALVCITNTSTICSIAELLGLLCEDSVCPSSLFPLVLHFLSLPDDPTVEFACHILIGALSDASNVQALVDAGCLPRCVELLNSDSLIVQQGAITAVNACVGEPLEMAAQIFELGALPIIKDLLSSPVPAISRAACVIIYELIFVDGPGVQHLIDAGVYSTLYEQHQAGALNHHNEVATFLSHSMDYADNIGEIRQLIDQGLLTMVCSALVADDVDVLQLLLQDIWYFLGRILRHEDDTLLIIVVAQFINGGGIEALQRVVHLPSFARHILSFIRRKAE